MSFKTLLTVIVLPVYLAVTVAYGAHPAMAETPDIMGPTQPPAKKLSVYERPYNLWESDTDTHMLKRNTAMIFGAGLGAMGILYMMPSSVTNWEDDEKSPFSKWWHNVSRKPVWDEDEWWLNYITHPYAGAVYYMGARSAGASASYSFAYSFALSTFFWEYGIEAFAERPSIQDLIVTPTAGAIVGEGFYKAKRHIVENDYKLLNSRFLGVSAAILMDPISEIGGFFWDDPQEHNFSVYSTPFFSNKNKFGYSFVFSFSF